MLTARQYLVMKNVSPGSGIRASCVPGPSGISLRALLSSLSADIFNKWQSLGGANGPLGSPAGEQKVLTSNGNTCYCQKFEHGSIMDLGYGTITAALDGGGLLPPTPYKLTLESIKCYNQTSLEPGEDELMMRIIISGYAETNGSINRTLDYRYDNFHNGDDIWIDKVLYDNILPVELIVSFLAVESDIDYEANHALNEFEEQIAKDGTLLFDDSSDEMTLFCDILESLNVAGICMSIAFAADWYALFGIIGGILGFISIEGFELWSSPELIYPSSNRIYGAVLQKCIDEHILPGNIERENLGDDPAWGEVAVGKLNVTYRYDNYGDILEERRFKCYKSGSDYGFTFRHRIGNTADRLPDVPYGLSIDPSPYYIVNYNTGHRTLAGMVNHVYWMVSSLGDLGYELERKRAGESAFTKIAAVTAKHPTTQGADCEDTIYATEPGELISYRVRARNKTGFSAYSDVIMVNAFSE